MSNFHTQLNATLVELTPYIKRQTKSYASHACTADDIVQDVFIRCMNSPTAQALSERPKELQRFVMHVAKKHATAVGRSARRKSAPQPLTEAMLATISAVPSSEAMDDDTAAVLASELFDQLTGAARLALWLAVETKSGKTQAQLAEELRVSARTVQRYMAMRLKGTSNLRDCIERTSNEHDLNPMAQDAVCAALLRRLQEVYPDVSYAKSLLQYL